MRHYYLFLDESGDFREHAKQPSAVAGFLCSIPHDAAWADKLLRDVKQQDKRYAEIPIPFHAMEAAKAHVPFLNEYICDVLRAMHQKELELVDFKNTKGSKIFDNNSNYLNIFADGILQLLRMLLKQGDDEITLDVLYAQRQHVDEETSELLGRIPSEEYVSRLDARLELFIAKLPSGERGKLRQRPTLRYASGTKNALLNLADLVCFALRGGYKTFSSDEKSFLRSLKPHTFTVPEQETWAMIQDAFSQSRYADAIYLWYGGLYADLSRHTEEFERQLVTYCAKNAMQNRERQAVSAMLSEYLHQLTSKHAYETANAYLDQMERHFFPLMRENGIDFERLYFDHHFHRLTTATHQGDCAQAREEMAICRAQLKKLPATYEMLDDYLRYKLREVEALKNEYAFGEALEELNRLEDILSQQLDLLRLIDGLGEIAEKLTSSTLGKVYGSRLMTHAYLGLGDPAHFASARDDFQNALQQFDDTENQQREYQSHAAALCLAGDCPAALAALAQAVSCAPDDSPADILDALLGTRGNGKKNWYGLRRYTDIMAAAIIDGEQLGISLYNAFCKRKHELDLSGQQLQDYPLNLICWRLATAEAKLKMGDPRAHYQNAITRSRKNPRNLPCFAASLVMELERAALLGTQKDRTHLKKNLASFLEGSAPDSMKAYFKDWQKLLEGLEKELSGEQKNMLLAAARKVPVL